MGVTSFFQVMTQSFALRSYGRRPGSYPCHRQPLFLIKPADAVLSCHLPEDHLILFISQHHDLFKNSGL